MSNVRAWSRSYTSATRGLASSAGARARWSTWTLGRTPGAGGWTLPTWTDYTSSILSDGWYRVKTRHTISGSDDDVFYSQSDWIEIN